MVDCSQSCVKIKYFQKSKPSRIFNGPGLGGLRHLRPVDGLAEGVVVVDDDSHHEPVLLLRLEVKVGGEGDDKTEHLVTLLRHEVGGGDIVGPVVTFRRKY